MISKNKSRQRRALRTRAKIRELAVPRLTVYRSANHIYAQVIAADNTKVIAIANTVEKALKDVKHGGNKDSAAKVGKLIAERAKKAGISKVAFDRSGYQFHGRIKALADAAREGGLDF